MSNLIERLKSANRVDQPPQEEVIDEIERLTTTLKNQQHTCTVLAKRIAKLESVRDAATALVSMDGLPSAVQFVLLKEALSTL